MQKYSLNESYFSIIDDEHKAYWLGFLYADGSLSKTTEKSSGKNRLQIVLSEKDIELLVKFKNDICFTGNIHVNNYDNSYNKNGVNICYMHVNSRKLCSDLESFGMDLKCNRSSIPNIPQYLIRHFIRGYFDGDGCISVYEYNTKYKTKNGDKEYYRKCQEFSITTQEDILLQFKSIFEKECNVSKRVSLKRYKRTTKALSLRYGGKEDIIALYHYLYDYSTIYLQRKYDNFQKVLL